MKIRWASINIINPAKKNQYSDDRYPIAQAIGIDTSSLYVANSGVRGAKDLVWVGRAANYAAKLSALPSGYIYITDSIYFNIANEAKYSSGVDMWEQRVWTSFQSKTIYRSSYHWRID